MRRLAFSLSSSLGLAALVFTCLAAPSARADFNAALCERARGSHVDVMTSTYSQACLGHVEHDAKGVFKRIVTLPEPMSGDVRASRDLSVVVYVATYLPLLRHEALEQNPVVVRAYRNGVLVKEQRLSDIAKPADITESTSHIRFSRHLDDFVSDDGKLVLITNSGTRVVIAVPK